MTLKRFLAALIAPLLAVPLTALASTFPDRPITLMHGFGAGGNADVVSRIVAEGLARELGQPVVVTARTGAGGNIASAHVATQPADGYTLILMTGGHAVSAAMYRSLAFDPVRSFEWLSVVTQFPFVLAVKADNPMRTAADVIAAARARPGQVSFSSVGVGSTQHLSGELLQSMAGVQLNHIPYRGGAAPLQDVLGGNVDMMFDSVTVTRSQIEAGNLHAIGVTSPAPWPTLPNVPPLGATVPGYSVMSWLGVAAPRGLPPAIATRLHGALVKVLGDAEVVKRLEATGGAVRPSASGAEMETFVAGQVQTWQRVVREAGIPQR
jgi:tripartite-type tricarboxylate transporter receptor subunit TctC